MSDEDTSKKVKTAEFWMNDYVRQLPPLGKLAYNYARGREHDGDLIVLEDMSLAVGLPVSECEDWLDRFIQDKMLDMEGV